MLAIAHRAANSLEELAGPDSRVADIVEADVRWYRGGLEVRHLKTAGPLPVLWDRWELASASDPRLSLAELLRAERPRADLMLDLKGRHRPMPGAVARALQAAPPAGAGILVCGRHWPVLDEVARQTGVRTVLSARNRLERRALEERVLGGDRPPPYGASVHLSLLDAPLVARLQARGVLVMTWPVDDPVTLAHVDLLGVDGVITNSSEILRAVRARAGTPRHGVWARPHPSEPPAATAPGAG